MFRDGPATGEIISHLCRFGIFGYFGLGGLATWRLTRTVPKVVDSAKS